MESLERRFELADPIHDGLMSFALGRAKDCQWLKSCADFRIKNVYRLRNLLFDGMHEFAPFRFHLPGVSSQDFLPLPLG